MDWMKLIFVAFRKFMNVASYAYIIVSLDLLKYIESGIVKPLYYYREFLGLHGSLHFICPIWLCGRTGFVLYNLRKNSKLLSKKRDQLQVVENSLLSKLCGLKTPLENVDSITGLSLSQFRQRVVIKKDLKVLDAVEALQVHLIRLMRSTSGSIAEIIFDADVSAILADQSLQQDGASITALHGIPVCLSNCFCVRGEDSNASAVFLTKHSHKRDCVFVENLREAGAIPVALVNAAALPLQADASSRLYGSVQHPTHPNRVVGSSSNAVVVRQKGAFLGFGLEVVGDVRMSAANVGIIGFKPTAQRLSTHGIVTVVNFPEAFPPTTGIVGLHVADIEDALVALTSVQEDFSIPKIPLQLNTSEGKLRIGVYTGCPDVLPVVPGVERVISEVKQKLRSLGHDMLDVTLPQPEEAMLLALHSFIRDESYWNVHVSHHYGNSLTWKQMFQCWLTKTPFCLRFLLGRILKLYEGASCSLIERFISAWRSPYSAEKIRERAEKYQREFLNWWSDEEIDVLIAPTAVSPALLKQSSASLALLQVGYTAIYNLVNCPAGVVPFGTTTKRDVELAAAIESPPRSLYRELLRNQQTAEGLPMSVQVISRPWRDNLVLRVMRELEDVHI